jgi:hypothetical protein
MTILKNPILPREKMLFHWDSLLKMSIFALVKFKHNKQ